MSVLKIFLNKYVLVLLILETVNALIFDSKGSLFSTFQNQHFQFLVSVIATFMAALLISNYFHTKQEREKNDEKIKNEKKCNGLLFIIRKNRIQSSRILPSEEDFTDNYLESVSNFQLSESYFERIQNIIYSNIDFIPPKTLSRILPILTDFPIVNSGMAYDEILRERANAELCLSRLTSIISDESFCDGN